MVGGSTTNQPLLRCVFPVFGAKLFGPSHARPLWRKCHDLLLRHTRPGNLLHSELENHHAIIGKIHYFDWAIFNSYVSLPEGKLDDVDHNVILGKL